MYKTKRYQDFTLANGEDVELETEYSPADWIEPTIVEVIRRLGDSIKALF